MEKNNLKTKIKMKLGVFLLIIVLTTTNFEIVSSLMNPVAAYCENLGYEYVIKTDTMGNQYGFCKLPDGRLVDPDKFLRGEVAQEYSYCKKKGYEIKTIWDNSSPPNAMYAVCILEDGSEVEVTELMKLNLEGTACGDGFCRAPENFKKCPEDCSSGEYDMYCDGVKDGKCDPDCLETFDLGNLNDIDCINPTIIAIILITILLTVFVIWYKKFKR